MRISSVKPAPWLAVNLHHLFQMEWHLIHRAVDHWQAMQYRFHYRRWIAFDMNVILRRLSVIYRPALLSNMHFYSTLYIASNHSHMRLNLHSGRLNESYISHWLINSQIYLPVCELEAKYKFSTDIFSLGLLDYDKNHNHDYFGQYCNHNI